MLPFSLSLLPPSLFHLVRRQQPLQDYPSNCRAIPQKAAAAATTTATRYSDNSSSNHNISSNLHSLHDRTHINPLLLLSNEAAAAAGGRYDLNEPYQPLMHEGKKGRTRMSRSTVQRGDKMLKLHKHLVD